jgi:hypothetical protein
METSFRKAPSDHGEAAWDVIVDGAVVGRIMRRRQTGRNLVSEDEAGAVQREITRPRRTRDTAASHLLDAYKKAGVALPQQIER